MLTKIKNKLFPFDAKNIKGSNNRLVFNQATLRKISLTVSGSNNEILIKKGCVLNGVKIYIRGNNHRLILDEKCVCSNSSFWLEDNDCQILIGASARIEGAAFSAAEPNARIIMGKNCLLAYDIDIRTTDSHSILDVGTKERLNHAKDVIIEDHVWIGACAKILKGVSIGRDSVIGLGSVVTKSIPCNCVVAGNPAKVIKENISWQHERIY